MSYQISLSSLVKEQYKLDLTIQSNHNVSYEDTFNERKLALLVELGEFANTTRCFKFWSNKGMDEKDIVLDEAADCLHFYLSLYITQYIKNIQNPDSNIEFTLEGKMKEANELSKKELTKLFVDANKYASIDYHDVSCIIKDKFDIELDNSFSCYLSIIAGLGFNWGDLEKAYYKKLGVNYNRQETNY